MFEVKIPYAKTTINVYLSPTSTATANYGASLKSKTSLDAFERCAPALLLVVRLFILREQRNGEFGEEGLNGLGYAFKIAELAGAVVDNRSHRCRI